MAHPSDSSFTIDDDGDNNNSQSPPPIMPPPLPPPMQPLGAGFPAPPPGMMTFDMTTGQYHPDFMFCTTCSTCQDPDPNRADRALYDKGGTTAEAEILEATYDKRGHETDSDDGLDMSIDDDDSGDFETVALRGSGGNEDSVILRSKFKLVRPITSPSHVLVIQSLLHPLPGVFKVIVPQPKQHIDENGNPIESTYDHDIQPEPQQIIVVHDARMTTDSIIKALANVGHEARLQPHQAPSHGSEPLLVRSHFAVEGVCCASEIPALRRIVKPLRGVSKLQVNLTTKIVYVQHDATQIRAQEIASALTREGFRSVVKKDGSETAVSQRQAMNHGRSSLHVQGELTEQDIPAIHRYLSQIPGVSRIGIIVSEGVIHVDHDVVDVSSEQCVEQLKPHYVATVTRAAEEHYKKLQQLSKDGVVDSSGAYGMTPVTAAATVAALEDIGRSKYVESTITIEGFNARHLETVRKAISQNFIRAQIRAIYPNVLSHTVKVEHDPKLVSTLDICNTLNSYPELPNPATVSVNGADLNLYLPEQENYSNFVGGESGPTVFNDADMMDQLGIRSIRLNVILSGVFWFISILSFKGGLWDDLKYFGLLSVLFGLPPIAVKAWRTIRRFQFDANCMMVTAAVGALILQEYDEAASVAFLFAVSEFLEARATLKARKALSAICSLRPDHANVIHPITKELVVIPADRVPLGSLIAVKTGDKIATDGVIVEGSSAVDESSLTGESKPVHKQVHDSVSGGTINIGTTQLVVRTTTTVEDSAVSRLIRLVEEAQSNRSPTEKMIDTFARSYTPVVVFMALLMCTIPWAWGTEVGRYWTLNGLIIIVIACPCALTISTPVTYAAGLAATAQRGIIVKGGANLEAVGSVDKIVFDKTGTLTQGKFSVINLEVIGTNKTRTEMLELMALLQGRSSHPLSATLVQAAKREGVKVPTHMSVVDHSILKGEGVTAKIDGTNVYAGNRRLFARLGWLDSLPLHHKDLISNWEATGGTVGLLGTDDHGIIGAFCVKDVVRNEAASVIQIVQEAGIETIMCTGDSDAAAHSVAAELGIPRASVHSQLLPEDKLHFVGSLKRPQPRNFLLYRNKKYVMFVGDGVNDAPGLAVADVGVSMGEGAAMAMETSDVTLMDSNLTKLPYVIQMGRRVVSTVHENIMVSLISKLIIVALTFIGKMTLLFAIAADVGIMLIVTLNGMKLLPTSAAFNTDFSSEESDISVKLTPLRKRSAKYSSVPTTMNGTTSGGRSSSPKKQNGFTTATAYEDSEVEMMSSPSGVDAEIV